MAESNPSADQGIKKDNLFQRVVRSLSHRESQTNSNGWTLAPEIKRRQSQADKYKLETRSHPEKWRLGFGNYEIPFVGWGLENRETPEQLVGTEKTLMNLIEKVLEIKEQAKDESPVIALDFGGMYSLSFLRIANQLEKKGNYISNGKVAVVVSNLQFKPDELVVSDGGEWDLSQDELKIVNENKTLVHYIQSDAGELADKHLLLPNGKDVPLNGNIDIVHEINALMHGFQNDIDLPTIAKNMSKYGVFMLGSQRSHPKIESDSDSNIRDTAMKLGKQNIIKVGFSLEEMGKDAHYDIFRKPDSPKIGD